ncbi:Protein-S-isoprenylcysteine O-methyltransferase Ste14 [Desulfatibacillum alkenivorans DSM 16219]|uniref:Protein-S-isoprenylcysteine O-methyltransferase Ste14 n=1 Tax=Desulfatibacillum alkenivorans DSM 16219 TaxID=1121393 RepID=A0A1M6PEV2_9BACT|nr:isoprenylcysteine carboxylmethyltransferase family protein [Desulfatibacillum alkenivorans]SHK06488.1 Protein-S-isoprenylcysteine O-methyltransferase Ste14 [Desulfatibacillum alkenivorans DSM 16219]
MALREEMAREGKWLFHRRGHLPLLLLIIVFMGLAHYRPAVSHAWDQAWEILCLIVAFLGLAVRTGTIGYIPTGTSGRSTSNISASALNTKGMYSIVRNPLYLGNALTWLGVSMLLRQWWVTLLFLTIFRVYYERIIFAEEEFLRKKFGGEFLEWAERTPVFIPCFKNWTPPTQTFSLRRVLRRDYSAFFAVISAFTTMELLCDWKTMGRPEIDPMWLIIFSTGAIVYLTLRTLKKKTAVLDAPIDLTPKAYRRENVDSDPITDHAPLSSTQKKQPESRQRKISRHDAHHLKSNTLQ